MLGRFWITGMEIISSYSMYRLEIVIRGGRHPVVENVLSKSFLQFVKNDCILDGAKRFALITG